MTDPITRRGLLGTTATASAAAALAGSAPAAGAATTKKKAKAVRKVDVVVVGAGLAGLTAARELVRAGKSVAVLEANPRVGGRILNRDIGQGHINELGGQFVGPTQNRIIALADDVGVKRYKAVVPGQAVYSTDGQVTRYDGDIPPDPDLADLALLQSRIDDMSRRVPVDAPWTAAEGGTWDALNLEAWIRTAGFADPDRTIKLVSLFFNSAYGSRPRDISLLYFLAQVAGFGDERNSGNLTRGISGPNGAQEQRFEGGSQLVALKVAEQLGRRVVLSSPVRRITQSAGSVTVVSDRRTFKARHVIVATPPEQAAGIDWHPILPPQTDALKRRMPLGTLMKCFAVYPEPFWRKDGLSGMALKVDGVIKEQFDNSVPGDSRGVLMAFMGGESWRRQIGRSPAQRKAAVLADLAETHGKQALEPIDYFEQDWPSEPWIRGGPVSVLGTGTLTDFGPALLKPFGRAHFAGTETSPYWNGYMDGAVRSGERAAREVLGA